MFELLGKITVLQTILLMWFVYSCTNPLQARASNIISFKEINSPTLTILIANYNANAKHPIDLKELKLSEYDLNGDSLPEFIFKDTICDSSTEKLCTYSIFAQKNQNLIALGTFKARKILVSDKKNHGISDILAYTGTENDYTYERFIWSSDKTMYILNKGN